MFRFTLLIALALGIALASGCKKDTSTPANAPAKNAPAENKAMENAPAPPAENAAPPAENAAPPATENAAPPAENAPAPDKAAEDAKAAADKAAEDAKAAADKAAADAKAAADKAAEDAKAAADKAAADKAAEEAKAAAADAQSSLDKIMASIKDGKLDDADTALKTLEGKKDSFPTAIQDKIAEARKALDAAKAAVEKLKGAEVPKLPD